MIALSRSKLSSACVAGLKLEKSDALTRRLSCSAFHLSKLLSICLLTGKLVKQNNEGKYVHGRQIINIQLYT